MTPEFTTIDAPGLEDEEKLYDKTPEPAPPAPRKAKTRQKASSPSPTPSPAPSNTEIAFRSPTVSDIDHLWDWIRADKGAIAREFAASSSIELHQKFAVLLQHEKSGHALVRSIDLEGDHIGFGSIFPIQHGTGVVHLYIAPDRRGKGVKIGREALRYAKSTHPEVRLLSITPDPRHVAFLGRVGLGSVQYFVSEGPASGLDAVLGTGREPEREKGPSAGDPSE